LDRPFDRYALPVAPFGGEATGVEPLRDVEGRVIWSAYRLEDPDASTAEVIAGYRARLAELGFTPVLDCATSACGGFDFRFAVQLLPAPAMLLDTAEFAQLSASRTGADGAESFASVLVSRVLGAIQIQTVLVLPAEAGRGVAAAPRAEAAAEVLVLPQDTESLLARLTEYGHVAVQGLEFETGGAALSAGSAPALETAARILRDNPGLSVVIVGHSDNQGSLEANIALSQRRAEAVRAALVERGVEPERLEAHGIGFLAPVTSNAAPDGKALNRRVELVLR
jgi:OOP family OmpA-OmpF porin